MSSTLFDGVGWTALMIAALRAAESRRPDALVLDPFAEALVDELGDVTTAAGAPPIRAGADARPTAITEALGEYVGVRTRYFDRYLESAVRAGVHQIVLLGAGMDGRAYRMPLGDGVRVFEIDTPDVLAAKDRIATAGGLHPRTDRHVIACDLRDDWPDALLGAGHDPTAPTAWLAEGLLFYLSPEDNDTLLARVTALSAAGSVLSTEYPSVHLTELTESVTVADDTSRFVGAVAAAGPGEPPRDWLARHGWTARVRTLTELSAEHGRDVSPVLERPGGPTWWFVTAER